MLDLMLIVSHRGRGQHFAQEQDHQPTGALAKHGCKAGLQIRSIQGFHAADLLYVLGIFLVVASITSCIVTMPFMHRCASTAGSAWIHGPKVAGQSLPGQ